jgi:hypothetical protein
MMHLGDAIERQQVVQRKRTIAWILFGILLPVSLLFWFEVIFALSHLAEVGILQLSAEFIVALFSALGAAYSFRSGMQFNRMIADTSRLLDDNRDAKS